MIKILAVEMVALMLALVSISLADAVYHSGRVTRRLHSVWVSLSIAIMCVPVLSWVAVILLGPGLTGQTLVGVFTAALFVALYRNLLALPAIRKLGYRMPPSPPPLEKAQPPTSG
jgi:hypothetical protein